MEKIKSVYSQYRVSTAFKPYGTELLAAPKDKASDEDKSGLENVTLVKDVTKFILGRQRERWVSALKNIAPRRLPTSLL